MAMEEKKFWEIIAQARENNQSNEGGIDDVVDALEELLVQMEDEEVVAFQHQMYRQYCRAFDYRIIGAAYVILGKNCDSDDHHGFRGWLIANGGELFNKVLANPDILAHEVIVRKSLYLPDIISIADEVYEASTGDAIPDDPEFEIPDAPLGEEILPADLPRILLNFARNGEFDRQINRLIL